MQEITARLKKVGKWKARDYLGISKIYDIQRMPQKANFRIPQEAGRNGENDIPGKEKDSGGR
jgi:hypothetical protein